MSVKGVIFDFNGTLFPDSDKHLKSFHMLFREYGVPDRTDEYIIRNIFGRPNGQIMKNEVKADADESDIERFSVMKENAYRSACLEDREDLRLAKGAPEFLGFLKASGIPYAMATGSEIGNVRFYFEYLNIGRWFTYDNIVYDDGKTKGKPEPDIYIKAAEKIGLRPSECIVFEDATSGIKAANAAGAGAVYAILDDRFPSPLDGSVNVDGTVKDFTGYLEILKKHGVC